MEPVGLPTLVSSSTAVDAASASEAVVFSPMRSNRRAQPVDTTVNKVATASDAPQLLNSFATTSPAPAPALHGFRAGSTSHSTYQNEREVRNRGSVSVNTTMEVRLGNGEVESVVARRLSTAAGQSGVGKGRSLSWFASAPRANTVEEDIQEEVMEEKQERAATHDVSPLEQFNAELMAYLEQNSQLHKRRDASGATQLADQEMVERHRREAQLTRIEQRRTADQKRFNLVDDMYDRALQRRYRAMQKIAADPPADRLIGHNMMQYLPAAMAPGGDPASRTMANTAHAGGSRHSEEYQGTTRGRGQQANDAANPVVFLTELEGIRDGREREPQSGNGTTTAPSPGLQPEAARRTQTGVPGPTSAPATRSLKAPEALVEQWRELGYDVMYVDGHGRALDKAASKHPPHRTSGTTQASSTTTTAANGYDEQKWMKLAPLPSVCLVQKRVARETMPNASRGSQRGESERRKRTGNDGFAQSGSTRSKTAGSTTQWSFGAQN